MSPPSPANSVCPFALPSLIPSLHTQQWGADSAPSRCFGAAQLCCECLSPSTPSLRDLHPFGRDRNPAGGISLSDPWTDTPTRCREQHGQHQGVCATSCWSHAGDKAPFVTPGPACQQQGCSRSRARWEEDWHQQQQPLGCIWHAQKSRSLCTFLLPGDRPRRHEEQAARSAASNREERKSIPCHGGVALAQPASKDSC